MDHTEVLTSIQLCRRTKTNESSRVSTAAFTLFLKWKFSKSFILADIIQFTIIISEIKKMLYGLNEMMA